MTKTAAEYFAAAARRRAARERVAEANRAATDASWSKWVEAFKAQKASTR